VRLFPPELGEPPRAQFHTQTCLLRRLRSVVVALACLDSSLQVMGGRCDAGRIWQGSPERRPEAPPYSRGKKGLVAVFTVVRN